MSTSTLRSRRRLPDLSWLKPPPMAEDGRMALIDHLREFRYRVIVSAMAILVGTIVAWFFYKQLFDVMVWPLNKSVDLLKHSRPGMDIKISYEGVAAGFMMQLKVSMLAGALASCPVWLYQLWAFIVPGLIEREKKFAYIFLAASVPLFLAGVAVGYGVMPKGYQVMLGFVPDTRNTLSLLEANTFLGNEMKLLLVFGASFLLPVLLVMLNIVGVVKGEQLRRVRTGAIFGCFVFGAVATPSTDPFSMTAMAVPMAILYVIAEIICVRRDKHRAARVTDLDITL